MHLTNEQFRRIRKVFRLTTRELGDLLDISYSYVAQIEKGKVPLTSTVITRLVEELQLTPQKLQRILEIYEEFNVKTTG